MLNFVKKIAVMATAIASAVTFSVATVNCTNLTDESITANAATTMTSEQITQKLTSLQSKYKNGTQWLTTSTLKYGGYQCYAFARQLAVDVFGTYPEKNVKNAKDGEVNNGWTAYRTASKVKLEPGDIIRSDYDSHSAMIWKIEGNNVYVGQCFGSSNNKINWGPFWGNHKKATISELLGSGFTGVWKHPGGASDNKTIPGGTSGNKLIQGGIYTIHPKGKNLYIAETGTKNCSNVCLSSKVNSSSKWILRYDKSKKAYYLVNMASNRVLDINGDSVKAGGQQNVQVYDKNSCATEYFDFINNSDGTYIIRSTANKKVCIDCYGSISTLRNGSNVWTYKINNDDTQKYIFTKVGTK